MAIHGYPSLVVGLALFFSVVPAVAPASPERAAAAAQQNAALHYWRVINSMSWMRFSEESGAAFDRLHEEGAETNQFLETQSRNIAALLKASALPHCEWAIGDYNGDDVDLSHLWGVRRVSQILIADARRCFSEGQEDAAMERVIAALRVANHSRGSRPQYVFEPLTSMNIVGLVVQMLNECLDRDKITEESRERLFDSLEAFDQTDAYQLRLTIRNEFEGLARWARRVHRPGAESDELRDMFVDVGGSEPGAAALLRMKLKTTSGLDEELEALARAIRDADAAWDAPDPRVALDELNARIEKFDYGLLVRDYGMLRVVSEDFRRREAVTALRARLQPPE